MQKNKTLSGGTTPAILTCQLPHTMYCLMAKCSPPAKPALQWRQCEVKVRVRGKPGLPRRFFQPVTWCRLSTVGSFLDSPLLELIDQRLDQEASPSVGKFEQETV